MSDSLLAKLFDALPGIAAHHAPTSPLYALLRCVARREIETQFKAADPRPADFGPFGSVIFPYFKMGAIDSLNLFDLDELILFSFYRTNRGRYHRVLDIGANIGLHSVILNKCGFEVRAYEPDPTHFRVLNANLQLNACSSVEPFNVAVSSQDGEMEFVRVLGNTTGSHLAGSKPNPYGELERFLVHVESIRSLLDWADLMKIDAEGHECEILLQTNREDWKSVDALVEVGTPENARRLFDFFRGLGVGLFAQKMNWQRVNGLEDMPFSHHEGTLFVTTKEAVPW
jgi:FkbM family methyltransferase